MGHKQRAYFNFTSDGVGDVARDEPGQLITTTAEDYPGVVYDFSNQIIKLRIGKTVEMPGRKSKLEYQFITPAINHDRVIPVSETRTAQCVPYCPNCCPSKCPMSKRRIFLDFVTSTSHIKLGYDSMLPSLPYYQFLTEEQKNAIKSTCNKIESCNDGLLTLNSKCSDTTSQANIIVKECLHIFIQNIQLPNTCNMDYILSEYHSNMSINTIRAKKRSVSFSDTISRISRSQSQSSIEESCVFGNQETTVYMTLFDEFSHHRTSSTQATATINKCLQAECEYNRKYYIKPNFEINSDVCSTSTVFAVPNRQNRKCVDGNIHFSDVYFFGRKNKEPKSGMGSLGSKTKIRRCITPKSSSTSKGGKSVSISDKKHRQDAHCSAVANKRTQGSSMGTCPGRGVSIKDDKLDPCPAAGVKGDMVATVSHIRIGPKEGYCPVHGKEPCQGPKCIVASSLGEQAPVKVTTVTNPRRGVFELVVRRMNGAPLAKNELMLEWTPPPSRPPPCSAPCPIPCSPPGPCRPAKCKMIVCRPSSCKPKCCKKGCKKPCGPMPCRSLPCKRCCKTSCCRIPCKSCPPRKCCRPRSPPPKCRPCLPCLPKCRLCRPRPRCRPCSPPPYARPCAPPCCRTPCSVPCRSSPCLRPCPVGRKKPRKIRSQPRIKAHKKRVSPCCNRTKNCPVVRCRSVPGPCFACCVPACIPACAPACAPSCAPACAPVCPPRKCCSVAPCKSPKYCRSSCSTCCG